MAGTATHADTTARSHQHLHVAVVTALSIACLAAQPPWLMLCYGALTMEPAEHWLAGFAWLMIAGIGSLALSGLGTLFGLFGMRQGTGGLVMLVINAMIFVGVGGFMLAYFGPMLWPAGGTW